jgi:spore germination protein KC
MKNRKLIILIFIVLINMIFSSGCWNYKEINQVAIVTGCAVDKGSDNKKYSITVETINIEAGGAEAKVNSEFFTHDGDTIFECIRNISLKTGRRLFWSHAKVIIISSDVAKDEVVPVIDWFTRDAETRSEMWVLISREKTAREILDTKGKLNEISSFHLDEIMRNTKSTSKFLSEDILGATRDLMAGGIQVVFPAVSVATEKGEKVGEVGGTAIFKHGKLIGWLNEEETRSMVWIRGVLKGGLFEVRDALGTNSDVILEIFEDNTKTEGYFEDGKFRFVIKVKADVGIAEVQSSMDVMEKHNLENLRAQAKNQISRQLIQVIQKAQNEYQSDIFTFGTLVQRKMPRVWKTVEPNWDKVFSDAKVEVNVDLEIIGSAKLSKPIKIGD